MTVYKKQDIPDRYHFKNHYRVPPLYLLTDQGYGMAWVSSNSNKPIHNTSLSSLVNDTDEDIANITYGD